jgi:hypothetical protein
MSQIPVISYLRYLQEVSRKILQRGGLENALYRKSRRQDACYFNFDRSSIHRPAYLRTVFTLLQEQPGRGLYLGLGLIAGQVQKSGKKRSITAPLLYCMVELDQDEENPSKVSFEMIWDSISLNYDLLIMFLEQKDQEEAQDDFHNPLAFDNRISPEKLKVLSDIERELERESDNKLYQTQLEQGPKLREFMKLVHDNISEFANVAMSDSLYEHGTLEDYVTRGEMTFFAHRFFFIAPVTDQLSTSVALHKLIRQVGQNGVRE